MSIELPGWVADAFNLVGLPWPGINEDQLHAWATSVRAFTTEITALSGSSHSAVATLAAANESSFARTLAASWSHHHRLISDLHGPLEGFAVALDLAAEAVVAQKLVVIGAAVVLAGEVIATQGEALVTFGLAEAEVPAEVAIARLAVKAALQELEGHLLGMLIDKAATEVASLIGGAAGQLIAGGGQVAGETVTLVADYQAMSTLSKALSGHATRAETASSASWRRASSGKLEQGGPGGGWREVARAVEQTILRVLKQLFVELGRTLWALIKDTIDFLKKAISALRRTDSTLAADAKGAAGTADIPSAAGLGSNGSSNLAQTGGAIRPRSETQAWDWADNAYDRIRADDDVADMAARLRDVSRLDGSAGFSADELRQIKDHVFFEQHLMDGYDGDLVRQRFDADPDMADAWLRLRAGRYQPPDLLLLEHELAESNYWKQHPDAPYREAHAAATRVADWWPVRATPTYEDYSKPWK